MDYESLALDLEELRRRLQDVPGFPSRRDDGKLIDRVNEAARGLGVVEHYLIEFRFKTYEVGTWASATISVAQPDGPTCGEFYGVPIVRQGGMQFHDWKSVAIPNRAKYAELLKRWTYHVRRLGVSGAVPLAGGSKEAEARLSTRPSRPLSAKEDAMLRVLQERPNVAMRGAELAAAMREHGAPTTEHEISNKLKRSLREAGIVVKNDRRRGYYLASTAPQK